MTFALRTKSICGVTVRQLHLTLYYIIYYFTLFTFRLNLELLHIFIVIIEF